MARTAVRDAFLFANIFGEGAGVEGVEAMTNVALSAAGRIYLDDVAKGVGAMEEDLDDAIARHARKDLYFLRLAAYKILRRDKIPASVSFNETVELALIYSSDEAPGFINGMLGAAVRGVWTS